MTNWPNLVKKTQKEAEANGILGHGMHQPFETMFEDVFEETALAPERAVRADD